MRLRNWSVQIVVGVSVIVLSFVAAMLLSQWQLVDVGRDSLEIARDSTPSIEHLTTARGEMRHLQIVVHELIDDEKLGVTTKREPDVEGARRTMDEALTAYLALPAARGEEPVRGDIVRARDALNVAVERCLAKVELRDFASADARALDVSATADQLSMAITSAIAIEAARSQDLALQIGRVQRRTRIIAAFLALACACIAGVAATAFRRTVRRHDELAEAHRVLLEARASELEQFAGRIAHDILSPLSVVLMALRRAASPGLSDEQRAGYGERGAAAVKRIDRLVHGLFAFAVAGAKPEAGARADLRAVMADLGPELRAAAERAGAELATFIEVTSPIGCNPGVLTSVVSNLALNAVKYIGDGPTKRIDIRAFETRASVRIEVQDTGPGLSPELNGRVFEPYVRGPGATSSGGIGLGLATVKKIATAHGGRVGVDSHPGEGATFWVELPRVQLARAAPRASVGGAAAELAH